jgi:hypothetical protein
MVSVGTATPVTARDAATLRSVALPAEHGGWSLTLEPVVLGLLVTPSLAGFALGGVALVGFLARTPLKTYFVDRYRGRYLARTKLAGRVGAVEFVLFVALLLVATATGSMAFWMPLLIAAPLVAVEVWFDVRSRSRRLVPELAGTVGVASMAAAIPLAGGAADLVAAGLWCVAAARAVATIPFVRLQLRRAKDQAHHRSASDAAQAVAVGATATGRVLDAVPTAGLIAIAALAAVHVWLARRPPPATPVLGAQEVVLGLTVVLATALGALVPSP